MRKNDIMSWLSQDITFCRTETCPRKEYCFRAIGCEGGIHSWSDFSLLCNDPNEVDYFMQADQETIDKYEERKTSC